MMPIIEYRRVYAAGRSLAITLPRAWLAYFGIKAGDEVQIVGNGELVIRPNHVDKDAAEGNARYQGKSE